MKYEEKENVIEWITGDKIVSCTTTDKKYVNKILKLAKQYPEEVWAIRNNDGSVYARFPRNAVKLSITHRVMTEEQKEAARIRMAKMRTADKKED